MIFRPFQQWPTRNLFYVVDSGSSSSEILTVIQERIRALEPALAVVEPRTLRDLLRGQLEAEAASLRMLGALAAIALLLTLVGVYGVVAHSVHRRAREMGLRLALGADSASLVRLVLGQSLKLASIGLGLGILIGLVMGQGLSLFLADLRPPIPQPSAPRRR